MKNILMTSLFLTLLVSCDSPQRSRNMASGVYGGNLSDNGQGVLTPSDPSNPTNPTNPTTPPAVTGTPGFENCDLSDKYHTIDTGYFGLCQSSQDETVFKFRTSLTSSSIRICLIPTYKEANGSSTYIGQPQCTLTTSNKVIDGKLYKNRSGYGHFPINGVIVMKEPLLNDYIGCMHGYVNWPRNACPNGASSSYCAQALSSCLNAQTSQTCDTMARNYMGQICTAFKTQYSNAYIDIKLK